MSLELEKKKLESLPIDKIQTGMTQLSVGDGLAPHLQLPQTCNPLSLTYQNLISDVSMQVRSEPNWIEHFKIRLVDKKEHNWENYYHQGKGA